MPYSVALIGLGSIGMGYDSKLPATDYVYSHARAFSRHPEFSLIGAVDPSASAREQFVAGYQAEAWEAVSPLMAYEPDVVVVASPTDTHLSVVREVLKHRRPKLILCEKPLAHEARDADEIVRLCDEADVQLYVNYIRRADPGVLEVKARLCDGRIATPLKAVVWYSKGLLHNGSHFLNLLVFWLGSVRQWQLISLGATRGGHDADPDVYIVFERGTAIFCAAKEEDFSHYTVELVAPNGRLRYEQGGSLSWQGVGPHPRLANYRILEADAEEIPSDMNRYQYHIVQQVSQALQGKANNLCRGSEEVENIRQLRAILLQRTKKT